MVRRKIMSTGSYLNMSRMTKLREEKDECPCLIGMSTCDDLAIESMYLMQKCQCMSLSYIKCGRVCGLYVYKSLSARVVSIGLWLV